MASPIEHSATVVQVQTAGGAYPIFIGAGLLSDAGALADRLAPFVRGQQVLLLTNPTIERFYGDLLREALGRWQCDLYTMGDGEQHKTLETYARVMDFLLTQRHNRRTTIIALGGGVVGDMAGFVASTFQRGVGFVQIPTTLLAQVDSSVGGKTAVNHPRGKNMIGAFYQPGCVIADTDVLLTLPDREYSAGLAEVVKYGAIGDADFFAWLEAAAAELMAREPAALTHAIKVSCEAKAKVVSADERETGVRAILNFGHTFGHALETVSGYSEYVHGEAVAVGMVMAAQLSQRLGMIDDELTVRLERLLKQFALPTTPLTPLSADALIGAMYQDKKVETGSLRLVLADGFGQVSVHDGVDEGAVRATLAAHGCP